MSTGKKIGGRREPPGGRPPKGNVRLVCYVQPETREAIDEWAAREELTLGEVVDRLVKENNALRRNSHCDSQTDQKVDE